MPNSTEARLGKLICATLVLGSWVFGQAANSPPTPYRPVENWAKLPSGVQWGQVISVEPDAKGIALAEGVSADAKGDIYAAGVSSMALHKFVSKNNYGTWNGNKVVNRL